MVGLRLGFLELLGWLWIACLIFRLGQSATIIDDRGRVGSSRVTDTAVLLGNIGLSKSSDRNRHGTGC